MIVESILEGVLSKYLDKWFYGITKDNMKAEVLKGKFVISNIGLRDSIFIGTNMPYDLRHSYVEKIQLNINWTSNERVLSVNISKIYALLYIKEDLDLDTIFMQLKKSSIKDFISEVIKNYTTKLQAEKEKDKEKKDGGISGFLKRLLDNVNINIKSVHLRFEDENKKYSFGLRIEQIQIINVNQQQVPQFFNREKTNQDYIKYRLTIDPLQFYLNPNQTKFLHKKDYAEITNEMIKMDSYKRVSGPSSSMFDGISQWNSSSFNNILTISIKSVLKRYINRQSTSLPEYECKITFNYIQSNISHLQFHGILNIVNEISWYQGMLQYYRSKVQLISYKQKEGHEIMNLIHKQKNSKKERQVVKKMTIKHLSWVFKQSLLEVKKRKFIQEAIKKDITAENLFQSEKIKTIIRKVQIHRIKQWVQISMEMRKRYVKQSSIFTEKSKQFQKFYKKEEQKLKQQKELRQYKFTTLQNRQQMENQVILKLSVLINKLQIKISENNMLGIRILMHNTKIQLLKRKQNFKVDVALADLAIDAFKMGFGQKYPTFVPILKKKVQNQFKSKKKHLVNLQFERSPIGKPFVFSSSKLDFQSIQITIYPEVLSNLFEIFIKQSPTDNQPGMKKKKTNVKTARPQQSLSAISGTGFQYNIIQGFIESPWIVIPLSHTNDSSKDCWVLRVGDLNIQTPSYQLSLKSDNKLFYERYFVQLKSFELKYFSSIDLFHIWLQHGDSLQSFNKLPGFQNNKYINVISPISCSVDLSMMKKHVSPLVKKTKQSFIAQIRIEKIFIYLPKILLDKLKQRVDVLGTEKKTQDFIETNPKYILEQNTIEGQVKISNQKFKDVTFYVVLKGHYLYFFLKDSKQDVIFTTDVRETTIRLTSDHHSYINENQQKKLNILLKHKEQHGLWKKHLMQLVSKRDRINDRFGNSNSMRMRQGNSKFEMKPSNIIEQISQSESMMDEDLQKIVQKEQTLISLSSVMESLEIQLIDEKEQEFLYCIFGKTKFKYSNLKQKSLTFSILEWQILERQSKKTKKNEEPHKKGQKKKEKKNIPFLSCKRLFKQSEKKDEFYIETKRQINHEESNFLQVKVFYNHITGELSEIAIKVDQVYISWNVPIFNKLLKFFFYKAEMADAPTAPSTKKKSLQIKFNMQKFYLYCFHDEELIALVKLNYITIDYSQNNVEQKYLFNCQKFQMDKYVDNDENKRVPMIICPNKLQSIRNKMKTVKSIQFSENDSIKFEDQSHQNIKYSNIPFTQTERNQTSNPFFLSYTVRKSKTEKFQNITKLKRKFGQDLLVSELKCTWKNFIIYFDQEQTIRLINYFISHILGTIAAKFKKKQYSLNYISQTLKLKKITAFDIEFSDFLAIATPHSRTDHLFQIKIKHVSFTKNIRDDNPDYEPKLVKVPTKRNQISIFYDTMVFDIKGVLPFYKFRYHPSERLTDGPLDLKVTYSKLNFSREYEPILNSLSDIDRTVKVSVKVLTGFKLQFQKIVFLTFLQIFYQNIKHRDGKAEKFETPHPFPALKIYQIELEQVDLQMYEYVNENQQERQFLKQSDNLGNKLGKNSIKNMNTFEQINVKSIKIIYTNQGQDSQIQLKLNEITGFGQLPVYKKNQNNPCCLTLNMNSVEGETFLKLVPQNLQLQINLDRLNQIIEFTNYDSDYTSNKIMIKKKKDSFMTVNVFPEKCCVKIGELQLYGDFFITYKKDFKNPVDPAALKFLFSDPLNQKSKNLDQSYIKQQVSDKQIKVNGQNLSVYINKKHIGILNRLFFGRIQYSSKQTWKRYRKQNVVIDGLSAMANILELQQLYKTYETYIKKAKDYKDKIFLLPEQQVPTKPKSIQMRIMQVQFEKSYVNVMRMLPERQQKIIPPFMSYMTIVLSIPKISYSTYLKEQLISITGLCARVMQRGGNITNNKILQCLGLRLHYREDKQMHSKSVQIENAKNIKINIRNMNENLFALLGKQIMNLKLLKKIERSRNNTRKISSDTFVFKQNSLQKISFQNEESIQTNSQKLSQNGEEYCIVFQNLTCKSMQIYINNFNFTTKDKGSKFQKLVIPSKGFQVCTDTGIKILQFLDQSSKQTNLMTELGFRQEGHGPIVRKAINQILQGKQIQLFSTCSIKFQVIPNGLKLEIFQHYSIANTTSRPILVCLIDKKRNKINTEWIILQSFCQTRLPNIGVQPFYLILADYTSKIPLSRVDPSESTLIQISKLASNISPNKIGPIKQYPTYLMQIIKWESQEDQKRFKLVIFNRFRLQNNIPASTEANFTTVQAFKESVIQSNFNANTQPRKLKLRLDTGLEIKYDIEQILKYFQSRFVGSRSKPKKEQSQLTQYEVPFVSHESKVQTFYKIFLCCKLGSASRNSSSEIVQSKNLNMTVEVKNNVSRNPTKISSEIQSFVSFNQIVIVINCHYVLKNAVVPDSQNKYQIGCIQGSQKIKLKPKQDSDYIIIPQKISSIYFQSLEDQRRIQEFQLQELTQKSSVVLWDKYIISNKSTKIGKQKQNIIIVEDLCTIQNKTNHIIEALYFNQQNQSNKTHKKVIIYPRTKINVQIKTENGKLLGTGISVVAYCKNKHKIGNRHLACTTKLSLPFPKNRADEQTGSISQTLYWYLNPAIAYPSKQILSYQSSIIKVTTNLICFSKCTKYYFIFESESENSQITVFSQPSKQKINLQAGYKFVNNLPKNYSILIREQKGILPELCPINRDLQKYYEQNQLEENMKIPLQNDEIPTPIFSHKKSPDRVVENELMKKQSNKSAHRLEFQRQRQVSSSRSKVVEYLVDPNKQLFVGLTNLQYLNKKSRTFLLQIYRTDCNFQFEEQFQIRIDEPDKVQPDFVIKEDIFKSKAVHMLQSIQIQDIQSISSGRSAKNSFSVISKKKSNNSEEKCKQYRIYVQSHKKSDETYEFFIDSEDLTAKSKNSLLEELDYKRNMELKIFQISLTIQVTDNPKDTVTLQLLNLKFDNVQLPPSSHLQQINLKIDKLLIREDKNLSILQMLNSNSQLLSVSTSIQKKITGKKIDNLMIKLSPIQLNIRQGIMFKVLSRVVQLRNQYFLYGQKLDEILNSDDQNPKQKDKSAQIKKLNKNIKQNSKPFKIFIEERQKLLKKQLKKSNPKIIVFNNFNIQKTSIYLSFSKDDYVESKEQFIRDPVIKYFILIPAVSELRLDLPQIKIEKFKGTDKEFSKIVLKKMKPNIGGTVLRSLSSLNVLDSPVAAIDGVFQYLQAILMINSN